MPPNSLDFDLTGCRMVSFQRRFKRCFLDCQDGRPLATIGEAVWGAPLWAGCRKNMKTRPILGRFFLCCGFPFHFCFDTWVAGPQFFETSMTMLTGCEPSLHWFSERFKMTIVRVRPCKVDPTCHRRALQGTTSPTQNKAVWVRQLWNDWQELHTP